MTEISGAAVDVVSALTADQVAAIDDLVRRSTEADGVSPLNEEAGLRLHDPYAKHVLHVRATNGDRLVGYAIAALGDAGAPVVLECVVDPAHRRRGVGAHIVRTVIGGVGASDVHAWAHGDLPGAAELADNTGFERIRVLLRLRTHLVEPLAEAPTPDGITIRTFRPGADDAAWLELNARAFADHPEQGSMTQRDLDARTASAWFDPAGFFLAERNGDLVGFHWTKVPDPYEPVGEVFVVGVDPSAQGAGLGLTLTRRGLVHLQQQGVRTVELYVEGDNAPALKVYRRLGFDEAARDVMYRHR
ncbi:MAG: mycothiol synthase [Nocardioidaceae bacterium]